VPTVVIMPKKNAARTTAEAASGKERRRRRRAPPWGDLLGGKPIERCDFLGDNKLDLGAGFTQEMQYLKMQRQYAAAVAAVKEKGVLSGKRVERRESGAPGEFADLENMSAGELADFIRKQAEESLH
jgi:hypothetical protein